MPQKDGTSVVAELRWFGITAPPQHSSHDSSDKAASRRIQVGKGFALYHEGIISLSYRLDRDDFSLYVLEKMRSLFRQGGGRREKLSVLRPGMPDTAGVSGRLCRHDGCG